MDHTERDRGTGENPMVIPAGEARERQYEEKEEPKYGGIETGRYKMKGDPGEVQIKKEGVDRKENQENTLWIQEKEAFEVNRDGQRLYTNRHNKLLPLGKQRLSEKTIMKEKKGEHAAQKRKKIGFPFSNI